MVEDFIFYLGDRMKQDERPPQKITIDYTNYRGERRIRTVMPIAFYFGVNNYHEGEQWFMEATDLERNEIRVFALNQVHAWNPQ